MKLINDNISRIDIKNLISWLGTHPRLTMGEKTLEFEKAFAEWLGVEYAVYVNSGSSANLLMVYALKYQHHIKKMAVPALSWSTDIAPLMQLGIEPVLIDCNMDDLSLDLDDLEEQLEKDPEIEAVFCVSILGLIPNMHKIQQLCDKYNAYLIEDNCESIGSQQGQRKLGTWGVMSSFSFYFGHHISTIEGGMIVTDDDVLYNLLKMLRSHGWARDVDSGVRKEFKKIWDIDNYSDLYTFYIPGFNLRATDLQAYIGLLQLNKLDGICRNRYENFKLYLETIAWSGLWTPNVSWFDYVSNFAYPVISENRGRIVGKLAEAGIETRPLIAGSMGDQPFYKSRYGEKYLPNARRISKQGFYVPNHPGMTTADIKKICRIITNNK